jgi:ribosome maturation protein SDO1
VSKNLNPFLKNFNTQLAYLTAAMAADFRAAQVRLTNVAIVRLKKNGVRFEVAAYKNKVMNYRNHIETDITEVLQIQSVFLNVSKALLAPRDALIEAFGTDDQAACALVILEKGELEVSEKERSMQYETLFRDVAATVAAACINPDSQRPYPATIIEKVGAWMCMPLIAGIWM